MKLVSLNKYSIILSVTCIVHCISMPFIMLYLPSSKSSFLLSEVFHSFMVLFMIITSVLSLLKSYKSHKKKLPIFYIGFGYMLITACFTIELNEMYNESFTVIGMILITFGHTINHKKCCRI